MTASGLPFPDPEVPEPEPKLGPEQGALRGPRPRPARFNGRIAALLATGAAALVTGALFIPGLLPRPPRAHDKTATAGGPAALPTLPPVSYAGPMATERVSTGAAETGDGPPGSGFDCAQYPGLPGCTGPSGAPQIPPAQTGAAGLSPSAVASANPSQVARASGLFFGGPVGGGASAVPAAAGPAPAAVAPQAPSPSSSPAPPGLALASPGKTPAEAMGQNGLGEKAAFLRSVGGQDYVAGHLEQARSPYEVKAGAVIPAALLTTINSDLPGEVVAQVTQSVFDHVTGRYVLIPQGSRLIGRYDSQVVYGQNRAMVVWRRVIFPNGSSLNFGAMTGTDPSGAAGISDQVNDHFGQLARGIVLSSLLSMGAASAQSAQTRTSGALVVNAGASGVATGAETVGSRIADRDMNRQPTLIIRAGAQMRVLVSQDMILEPYPS